MKHVLRSIFFAMILLYATNGRLYGMLLRRTPSALKSSYRGTTLVNPRTLSKQFHTSPFRSKLPTPLEQKTQIPLQNQSPTTLLGQFKNNAQSLKNLAQELWQRWLGSKTSNLREKTGTTTIDDIIEKIKTNSLEADDRFRDFMVKNNENVISELLDRLIFPNENDKEYTAKFLEFLESIVSTSRTLPKIGTDVMIEKIIHWASNGKRIFDLLRTSTTTHHLALDLIALDSSKTLLSTVIQNYKFINQTEAGSIFINLVMEKPGDVQIPFDPSTEIYELTKQWIESKRKILAALKKEIRFCERNFI